MKTVVIYETKYGSTKDYAEWIAEELKCPIYSRKNFSVKSIDDYDTFIIGSCVQVGSLKAGKWLNQIWPRIEKKKVILFSVSGAGPSEKEAIQGFLDKSISQDIQKKVSYFPLQGRQIMSQYPFLMRFMLKMVANMSKDPAEKAGIAADYDFVKKENIAPIVQAALKS